jgi:chromosome segregation ATPase
MKKIFKIKDNATLRFEKQKLESKIVRLENRIEDICSDTEKEIIDNEDKYNKLLEEKLIKNNNEWRKKYDKLKLKLSTLREKRENDKKEIEKKFNEINAQATNIYKLGIEIQPHIERLNIHKTEQLQNAKTIQGLFEAFNLQYLKFKNDMLEYTVEND